jgi:2-keto-4-pentenoate hydratase
VVTTGTWTGMPWAAPGDLVQVVFDGIGQASVQL